MKFSTASIILAFPAAPSLFVHGTNYHSLTCDTWPGVCDDDHDDKEERRTLLDAQRNLPKNSPPIAPRPVFCDEYKIFYNSTAFGETMLVLPSLPAQRGTKTCALPNDVACRGDNAQFYCDLYAEPSLTTKIGAFAENALVVEAVPDFVTLITGSMEVDTPEFSGEILFSNLWDGTQFSAGQKITAGSKSYLGATGTVETNTEAFKGEAVGELIVRCDLTNPSNP